MPLCELTHLIRTALGASTITIHILSERKLKLRDFKQFAQGQRTSKLKNVKNDINGDI